MSTGPAEPPRTSFGKTLMANRFITLIGKYWLLVFLIVLAFFLAILRVPFHEFLTSLSSLEFWQVLSLIWLYFLISLFLILARKYLLRSLSSPSRLKNLILIHFVSMAAHYTTPAKIGFPLTVYLLNRLDAVPYANGTTIVLIELFTGTSLCGIIAFLGSLFYFSDKSTVFLLSSLALALIAALVFYGVRILMGSKTRGGRVSQFIKDIHSAFSRLSLLTVVAYSVMILLIQLLAGFSLVLLALFIGAKLSLWQALIANSAAFFLGALSMIPMGLGVREGSMLLYLGHLGVSNEAGIAIVAVQRLLSTGLSLLLGTILGSFLGLRKREKRAG
jgi:uncharacterized membrane protein YbhN (UPF0104 family)